MDQDLQQCQNCDYQLKADFEFCPNCGQKVNEKLTLKVLFYNTVSNYFSVDARFLKSFLPLVFKPGFLPTKFIEGKRSRYLHPAQLYLFISVVFFFILSLSTNSQPEKINQELLRTKSSEKASVLQDSIEAKQLDSVDRAEAKAFLKNNKWLGSVPEQKIDSILADPNVNKNDISFGFDELKLDSLIAANASDKEIFKAMEMNDDAGWLKRKFYGQILKFYKSRDGGSILKVIYDKIPIALFFLLPLFALLLKLFYSKKGNYTHHLVFSFYYFSFLFLIFSIIFGINLIWNVSGWLDFLLLFSAFVYFLIALKRFYHQGWFVSFFKANVISFLFLVFILPATATILFVYAFLFY
ncbi:DUF3667 domain-containing protein [Subsaximicrobium wynnwilliamsii]|uniref:DUF3667 domain-containing protein n=1 Tax=Subsaximicrobium wynnwilliamsii TaxID=291179 RepID=A0A5C6ZKB1_9FLAO|nr:DUF3667 domain-containing protein [Subsaximicrobium wynnwilliamsii]TXD84153.1 DUF3667 domain-containing protein [Subsaximicrobium wynnwilliamsii]TXD89774.1 DUF3667 domain-containing protein [Subsaximicrobium wynnwilliamsii]TXE03865.1 DUF3667 domain-containing protein [Subsaximicrobium wynnwilliamsii]